MKRCRICAEHVGSAILRRKSSASTRRTQQQPPRLHKARNPLRTDAKGKPAVFQIVGYKNSGKTTLVCALIPLLQERGYTVAIIKHDVHGIEIDHPNTDTWKHREAGAAAIAITNGTRTIRMEERGSGLPELISSFADYDYVLVEGFKNEDYPKIVLIHDERDLKLLRQLTAISAIGVWQNMIPAASVQGPEGIPQYGINDAAEIANHLCRNRYYFQHFNI